MSLSMGRGRPRPRVLSVTRRLTGTSRPRPCSLTFLERTLSLHSAVRTPEEHGSDGLEDEVGQPENQMRREFGLCLQRLADDDEAVINKREEEGHCHTG